MNLQARQRKYIKVSKAKNDNIIQTSRAEQDLNDRAVGFATTDGMARQEKTKRSDSLLRQRTGDLCWQLTLGIYRMRRWTA